MWRCRESQSTDALNSRPTVLTSPSRAFFGHLKVLELSLRGSSSVPGLWTIFSLLLYFPISPKVHRNKVSRLGLVCSWQRGRVG